MARKVSYEHVIGNRFREFLPSCPKSFLTLTSSLSRAAEEQRRIERQRVAPRGGMQIEERARSQNQSVTTLSLKISQPSFKRFVARPIRPYETEVSVLSALNHRGSLGGSFILLIHPDKARRTLLSLTA
jgi:hypothetical protein